MIPITKIEIGAEERALVLDVLDRGHLAQGPLVGQGLDSRPAVLGVLVADQYRLLVTQQHRQQEDVMLGATVGPQQSTRLGARLPVLRQRQVDQQKVDLGAHELRAGQQKPSDEDAKRSEPLVR